jgi:DNA-binding CsgD family transcriptional regulator
VKARHAISLIETAYRLDLSAEQWLGQIADEAATTLDSKGGVMAFQYNASSGDWIHVEPPVLRGLSPEFARDFFNQSDMPYEIGMGMVRTLMSVRFESVRARFEKIGAAAIFGPIFDRYGIQEMVGVNGVDPSGRGCMLAIVDNKRRHTPRTVHLWHRLAAHVSAGNRLRTALDALTHARVDPASRAEAVLSPNGKVEHATGLAEPRTAREALRNALIRIDAAHSERDDAHRSVALWRGLVAGRWSLVEHFERDGKRYYLAHKNAPELAQDRALTPRERLVLSYAELGHSNKLIAYSLGLSSSTVATQLSRARKKAGIPG